jgi:hypothetical protein
VRIRRCPVSAAPIGFFLRIDSVERKANVTEENLNTENKCSTVVKTSIASTDSLKFVYIVFVEVGWVVGKY